MFTIASFGAAARADCVCNVIREGSTYVRELSQSIEVQSGKREVLRVIIKKVMAGHFAKSRWLTGR